MGIDLEGVTSFAKCAVFCVAICKYTGVATANRKQARIPSADSRSAESTSVNALNACTIVCVLAHSGANSKFTAAGLSQIWAPFPIPCAGLRRRKPVVSSTGAVGSYPE